MQKYTYNYMYGMILRSCKCLTVSRIVLMFRGKAGKDVMMINDHYQLTINYL